MNRFQSDDPVPLAKTRAENTFYDGTTLRFRDWIEQFRFHPEYLRALFGREPNDVAGPALIAEKFPGGQKNEPDDQRDSNVVLPACARVFPKNKPFDC